MLCTMCLCWLCAGRSLQLQSTKSPHTMNRSWKKVSLIFSSSVGDLTTPCHAMPRFWSSNASEFLRLGPPSLTTFTSNSCLNSEPATRI